MLPAVSCELERRFAQDVVVRSDFEKEAIMRFSFALSTVAIVAATSLTTATPGFARVYSHYYSYGPRHYSHHYRDYSGYLDPRSGHYDPEFQRNRENFGFSGRDPSRVGGVDPTLHPPGFGH
jgi:hypothetical protein